MPAEPNINKVLAKWVETAKIAKKITYHTSRHTFATMMLTLGADLYTVSKLLGHANVKNTQIYAKIVDSKKVEAVNLVDSVPKYSAYLAHSHLAGLLRPGVAAGIGERVDDDGCQNAAGHVDDRMLL